MCKNDTDLCRLYTQLVLRSDPVPTSFLPSTQYTFGFQIRFQAGKLEEPGEPVGSQRIAIHASDHVKEEEAASES
jgi:hypothetical protein